MDTPVRHLRLIHFAFLSIIPEEGVCSPKTHIPGKGGGFFLGWLRRGHGLRGFLRRFFLRASGTVLNVVQDEDHGGVLFSCLVRPLVLIQPPKQIDVRTCLQLHFLDAAAEAAEGFHRQVDPAVAGFLFGVVDLLPDAEPDGVPLLST